MTVKVGINGFGRIGHLIYRNWATRIRRGEKVPYDIVAANDITKAETLCHTLKYDTVYGKFDCVGDPENNKIDLPDLKKTLKLMAYEDPSGIPWKDLGVDIVIESTGKFTDRAGCQKHLDAGAKRVVLSAPGKKGPGEENGPDVMVVHGVNHETYDPAKHRIISNASCTTNCLAPIAKVLNDNLGIEAGLMVTIHAYTSDQRLVDAIHKDLRRARAAAVNMIPTSTGAAKAIGYVIPELKGKMNGYAVRVPTPTVSLVDLVCWMKKGTTREEVNEMLKKASETNMKGIIKYETEPLVSSDFEGIDFSAVVDPEWTMVTGDRLVKVAGWYDNEWGYVHTLTDIINYMISKGI